MWVYHIARNIGGVNFGESAKYCIGKKLWRITNFGDQAEAPNPSGGLRGVKLWRISAKRGAPEYQNNLQ